MKETRVSTLSGTIALKLKEVKKSRVSTLQSLLSIGELNRLRATCEEGEGNLSYLMPAFLPPSKCSDA